MSQEVRAAACCVQRSVLCSLRRTIKQPPEGRHRRGDRSGCLCVQGLGWVQQEGQEKLNGESKAQSGCDFIIEQKKDSTR